MQIIKSYRPASQKSFPAAGSPNKKARRSFIGRRKPVFLIALLVIGGLIWRGVTTRNEPHHHAVAATSKAVSGDSKSANNATTKPAEKRLKILNPNQFKELYDAYDYPNTTPATSAPYITSNAQADSRIQKLAKARGYQLRAQAIMPLTSIEGQQLQPQVIEPYKALKAAAAAAGLNLNIVSGYRSYNDQRGIFLGQMKVKNISADSIAAGQSDTVVDAILKVNSIPGFSRHHTGYTMDFQCGNSGLDNFMTTPCFTWLNANNYEQAKLYGFIPSYPGGATNQGPNPEEWEYVWVGTDILYEATP